MTPLNILKQLFHWVDYSIPDPGTLGNINNDQSFGVVELTIAAAATEYRYLPAPTKSGLRVTITVGNLGAAGTAKVSLGAPNDSSATVPAYTVDGTNKYATFSGYGQQVTLISIPASATLYKWSLLVNQGASLSAS